MSVDSWLTAIALAPFAFLAGMALSKLLILAVKATDRAIAKQSRRD
jgi:hypothetical protein